MRPSGYSIRVSHLIKLFLVKVVQVLVICCCCTVVCITSCGVPSRIDVKPKVALMFHATSVFCLLNEYNLLNRIVIQQNIVTLFNPFEHKVHLQITYIKTQFSVPRCASITKIGRSVLLSETQHI